MSQNSYYKIVKNKIFFSDRRTDHLRPEIIKVFESAEAVNGGYNPPTLQEALSENFIKKLSNELNLRDGLYMKIEDCRHKAEAAGYCLGLIKQEIQLQPTVEEIKNYSTMIANKMCAEAELQNEVLIFETEAFLFQIKSNLDILIQAMKYVYPYLDENKGKDGESFLIRNRDPEKLITNKMRKHNDVNMAEYFEKQVSEWIGELIEMRNTITHRSGLKGFASFIFESKTEKIVEPTMPNGRSVKDYCEETFNKLLNLYKFVIEMFILPKLVVSTEDRFQTKTA